MQNQNKEYMDRIAQQALDTAREATWNEVARLTTYLLSETMPEAFAVYRKYSLTTAETAPELAEETPEEFCESFLVNTILPSQREVLAAVLKRAAELATTGG